MDELYNGTTLPSGTLLELMALDELDGTIELLEELLEELELTEATELELLDDELPVAPPNTLNSHIE